MKNADLYNESTASTAAKETLDKSVEATVEAWKRNKRTRRWWLTLLTGRV
jgi:hypothetical protein